jgi:glutamine synthetase
MPDSLKDALDIMSKSELVSKTIGENVFEYFIKNKKNDWQKYNSQVTDYERTTLLHLM